MALCPACGSRILSEAEEKVLHEALDLYRTFLKTRHESQTQAPQTTEEKALFSGYLADLARLRAAALAPGQIVQGETVAELAKEEP